MKKSKINVDGAPDEIKALEPLKDKDWSGGTFVPVPIFNGMIAFFVGKREDVFKYINESKESDDALSSMLATVRNGRRPSGPWKGETIAGGLTELVMLRRIDLCDRDSVATMYHECLHAAIGILRQTGVEIGTYGESLAYLQEYIVRQLLSNLKRGIYGTLMPDGTRKTNLKEGEIEKEFK